MIIETPLWSCDQESAFGNDPVEFIPILPLTQINRIKLAAPKVAPTAQAPLNTRSVMDLHAPQYDGNDPNELLRYRFLCRGGAMTLIGSTGIGKSSLSRQLAMLFGLGRGFAGVLPARPLKSVIVQAENDEQDEAEMRDGIIAGLEFSEEDMALLKDQVFICFEQGKTGKAFDSLLVSVLERHKPDLIWIDPVLGFLGADASSQEAVGDFLRQRLAPLMTKYDCAAVLVHHTIKRPIGSIDPRTIAYQAAGSAEWANWPRGGLYLHFEKLGLFTLIASKRGSRLEWKGLDGQPTTERHISHSKEERKICWHEVENVADELVKGTKRKPTLDEYVAAFPINMENPAEAILSPDDQKKLFIKKGWDRDAYPALREQAVAQGRLVSCQDGKKTKHVGLPEVVAAYTRKLAESYLS